jgi:hypothetical protein
MTDEEKEMLIRVDERTERIDIWCNNHDVHHFRYNIMAWGIALTAIISLVIMILK